MKKKFDNLEFLYIFYFCETILLWYKVYLTLEGGGFFETRR